MLKYCIKTLKYYKNPLKRVEGVGGGWGRVTKTVFCVSLLRLRTKNYNLKFFFIRTNNKNVIPTFCTKMTNSVVGPLTKRLLYFSEHLHQEDVHQWTRSLRQPPTNHLQRSTDSQRIQESSGLFYFYL